MSELSVREEMVLDIVRQNEANLAGFAKRCAQFDMLCVHMPQFKEHERQLRYGGGLPISRADLGKLRKAVGRLKVSDKTIPWDYERSHELTIRVKPESEDFNTLSFYYRAPHKEGRCKVETQVSTYQTLVCSK